MDVKVDNNENHLIKWSFRKTSCPHKQQLHSLASFIVKRLFAAGANERFNILILIVRRGLDPRSFHRGLRSRWQHRLRYGVSLAAREDSGAAWWDGCTRSQLLSPKLWQHRLRDGVSRHASRDESDVAWWDGRARSQLLSHNLFLLLR